MTTLRYLKVTTKLSDQRMSERMPRTFRSLTGKPCGPQNAYLRE
jgi:hypothetical protein